MFVLAAFDAYGGFAQLEMAALFALSILVTPVYFVLVERGLQGFRRLQPKYCSIYDPYFWRHERLWKVPGEAYLHMFDGTPFKNLIWRALGVRIGRRVFDDGCYLTERTLDHHRGRLHAQRGQQDPVPLAGGRHVQVRPDHDRRRLHHRGRRMVHYGVTMGDGSVLAPDSFLMKGEEIPPHARWGGNPAREM